VDDAWGSAALPLTSEAPTFLFLYIDLNDGSRNDKQSDTDEEAGALLVN
jgi:hypothetical protein